MEVLHDLLGSHLHIEQSHYIFFNADLHLIKSNLGTEVNFHREKKKTP